MTDSFRELGDFLRRARANADATAAASFDGRIRRVPGLRREEVAAAAGVSTDYYTRLEQGRRIVPSAQVVAAIARAIGMDEVATAHVRHLVESSSGRPAAPKAGVPRVRRGLRQLVDALEGLPVLVLGYRSEVLATNRLAAAVFAGFDAMRPKERSYARWLLLSPEAQSLFVDWEDQARTVVGALRFAAGNHPGDAGLESLVGELTLASPVFAAWWAQHRVATRTFGRKRLAHSMVGALELDYESFSLPGDQDQTVYVYTVEPGSPSADALRLLASWSATSTPPATAAQSGRRATSASWADAGPDQP